MALVAASATWQPSLLDLDRPVTFDPSFDGARRRFLGAGAWIDVVPGWVQGADALFEHVLAAGRWKARTRRILQFLMDRAQESATWRGVILVLTGIGVKLAPDLIEAIVAGGLILAGILGAAFPQRIPRGQVDEGEPR